MRTSSSRWLDESSVAIPPYFLRAPSEGMHTLINAYVREKREGRDHADWLHWCQQLADWLLTQQREDGSFPRSWKNGTGAVNEESGTSSYDPVPLLVSLSKVTGNQHYLDSAVRAGEYVWENYGSHGVFVGGTTDNPNVVDKEAGMLSLEAFLSLYEATRAPKWLERAEAAGNYTESWIWIWNVPMPIGADDAQLQWKRGVSTIGVQGISARGPGGGGRVSGLGCARVRRVVRRHTRRALSGCRAYSPVRHQEHAGAAWAHVRSGWPWLAAGELGNGSGPQRIWIAPQLAAMDFSEPPAQHHRAGGIRSGSLSAISKGN